MKAKFITILLVTGTFFMASCAKKGPSEALKTKMTQFEADWKATGDQMTAWGTTMNTSMDNMNKMMTEMPMGDMSKMKPEEMAMMDTMKEECAMVTTSMNSIKTAYETSMTNWAADQTAYMDWKKKVASGEVKEEDAMKGMDEYMGKLTAAKGMMDEWTKKLAETEKMCTETCHMMGMHDMSMDKKGM